MTKGATELRRSVQSFVRAFGLLSGDQTPCGQPLAPSHAHALLVLLERGRQEPPAAFKQQDLAVALGLDKSSITRLCIKMVAAGHLRQRDSEIDGRAWALTLSAKGRRAAETIEEASKARFRRLADALPTGIAATDVVRMLEVLTAAVVSSTQRNTQ